MKIVEITVSAARKAQHPFLPYSSIDSFVMLKAQLSETDDPESCTRELRARAEGMVQDDINLTVNALSKLSEMSKLEQIKFNLADKLKSDQKMLDELRAQKPPVLINETLTQSDPSKGQTGVQPTLAENTNKVLNPTAPGLE